MRAIRFYHRVIVRAWQDSSNIVANNKASSLLVWLLMFISAGLIPTLPEEVGALFSSPDQQGILMAAVYSVVSISLVFIVIFVTKLIEAPVLLYEEAAADAIALAKQIQEKQDKDGLRNGLMNLITEGINLQKEVLATNNSQAMTPAIEDWYRRAQQFVKDHLGEHTLARFQNPNRKVTHRPLGNFSSATISTWAFFEKSLPALDELYQDSKR